MGRDNFVAPTAPIDVLADVLGGPRSHGPVEVPVGKINTTGGTQMRAGLDDATVFEYGQAMITANGWGTFPAVIAYHDGKDYWLADGFHRVAAFLESFPDLKRKIPVDVRAGTRRDAVLHAAGANAQHGLRRTNQDKRRAVETLLRDEEWRQWSLREIARTCAVSEGFVHKISQELSVHGEQMRPAERTVTRNGTTYTQNTANIGSKPAPVLNTPAPVVTLDELEVVKSVTVPVQPEPVSPAADPDEEITHPLDCYEDATANPYVGKMGQLHELKMWFKTTRNEKAREYAKLTGQTVPTWFIEGLDHMIATLETAMDRVEQEAAASVAA